MNAYELADYLDNNLDAGFMSEQKYIDMASEMLRDQADEIAKLYKALYKEHCLRKNIK